MSTGRSEDERQDGDVSTERSENERQDDYANAGRSDSLPFKPRARLLRLLGDELIRDANIAIFELVKNAYDADARYANVTLLDVDNRRAGRIVVEDDGTGMDWETITGVWLEPGTDFRKQQRNTEDGRSAIFGRLPLGEKGVGRFAAGKLGDKVTLITRAKDQPEVVVEIDWEKLLAHEYLSEALVPIHAREPHVFTGHKTGTKLEITLLRDDWSRRMVRDAQRAVTAICSPFGEVGDFQTELHVIPDKGWLTGLTDPKTVIEQALFTASGNIWGVKDEGNYLSYAYQFRPPNAMDRVSGRTASKEKVRLPNPRATRLEDTLPANMADHAIGEVSFILHIFDRDPQVLRLSSTDRSGLRQFLDQNGGIRVYRDRMRVYSYGEPEDDWLDLSGRRINVPTARLSNNIVTGAFFLDLKQSGDLIEKTNREGFVENDAYRSFRNAVMRAVEQITYERNLDKVRIRKAYTKRNESLVEVVDDLRNALHEHGMLEQTAQYVDRLEQRYLEMRDRLLTSAGAGLSLTIVIHEVEKGIEELKRATERDVSVDRIRELANHLSELVDGLTYLTRRSGRSVEKASRLVRQSLFNTEYRLRYHGIQVSNGFETGGKDFDIRCTRRLLIATLMNLIDNSIYWIDLKKPDNPSVYVGPSWEFSHGPAIVFADNGPGFRDSPEMLVEPFISNKPDGMGLGLHLADEVMKAHGGRLHFPEPGEINLPLGMDGAVVVLLFQREG